MQTQNPGGKKLQLFCSEIRRTFFKHVCDFRMETKLIEEQFRFFPIFLRILFFSSLQENVVRFLRFFRFFSFWPFGHFAFSPFPTFCRSANQTEIPPILFHSTSFPRLAVKFPLGPPLSSLLLSGQPTTTEPSSTQPHTICSVDHTSESLPFPTALFPPGFF